VREDTRKSVLSSPGIRRRVDIQGF
jgi:hypothetical protein